MLKYILLFVAISVSAYACDQQVTLEEAQRIIDAGGRTMLIQCADGQKGCVCADDIEWSVAEIVRGKLQNNPKKMAEFNAIQREMNDSCARLEQRQADVASLKDKLNKNTITDAETMELLKKVLK